MCNKKEAYASEKNKYPLTNKNGYGRMVFHTVGVCVFLPSTFCTNILAQIMACVKMIIETK